MKGMQKIKRGKNFSGVVKYVLKPAHTIRRSQKSLVAT
jgi:hypothetical protein